MDLVDALSPKELQVYIYLSLVVGKFSSAADDSLTVVWLGLGLQYCSCLSPRLYMSIFFLNLLLLLLPFVSAGAQYLPKFVYFYSDSNEIPVSGFIGALSKWTVAQMVCTGEA